jgi:serine/threonine protein kinase
MDFDQQSMASKATTKDEEAFADIRASTIMRSRRPTNVKLEDFEIKMQLGKGTFGRVFLAELPASKTLYAIKAIRKDVLIEYD